MGLRLKRKSLILFEYLSSWNALILPMLRLLSFKAIICKATPIYLLVLRAQEVGNEAFWNKKKS